MEVIFLFSVLNAKNLAFRTSNASARMSHSQIDCWLRAYEVYQTSQHNGPERERIEWCCLRRNLHVEGSIYYQ